MKSIIKLIAGALIFTACSSPKYSYYFDKYDYNSGRKNTVAKSEAELKNAESPLVISSETMSASATSEQVIIEKAPSAQEVEAAKKELTEKFSSMTKAEKKEFKKDLKKYVKSIKRKDSGQSVHATKAWDHDLKMAAIFGAIAIVLTALWGVSPVFWILGIVSLVVALVFLIQWLSRQ
jgi:hypothetical protein